MPKDLFSSVRMLVLNKRLHGGTVAISSGLSMLRPTVMEMKSSERTLAAAKTVVLAKSKELRQKIETSPSPAKRNAAVC